MAGGKCVCFACLGGILTVMDIPEGMNVLGHFFPKLGVLAVAKYLRGLVPFCQPKTESMKVLMYIGVVVVSAALAAFTTKFALDKKKADEEILLGMLYQQNAAEYKALCF